MRSQVLAVSSLAHRGAQPSRGMATSLKLTGSIVVAVASAAVLAAVRDGAVDVPDGVILVTALVVMARTAIRTASDGVHRRHPPE